MVSDRGERSSLSDWLKCGGKGYFGVLALRMETRLNTQLPQLHAGR